MKLISKMFQREGASAPGLPAPLPPPGDRPTRVVAGPTGEQADDSDLADERPSSAAVPRAFAPPENTTPIEVSALDEPGAAEAFQESAPAPEGGGAAESFDQSFERSFEAALAPAARVRLQTPPPLPLPRAEITAEPGEEELPLVTIAAPADRPLSPDEVLERALRGESLEGADLRRFELPGAILAGAELGRAALDGANLERAQLRKARLRGATLRDAQLAGGDLREADLEGADLGGARLDGSVLARANLTRVNLSGASLRGANLTGARLDWAQLRGADLTGAVLTDAAAPRADFDEAKLGRAGAAGLAAPGATMRDADLAGAELGRADLTDACLTGVRAARVRLTGASLRKADLARADLTDGSLDGTDLRGADLSGATLTRAELTGAKVAALVGRGDAFAEVKAGWIDIGEAGVAGRLEGEAALGHLRGRAEEAPREKGSAPAAQRYFGPGDVLRNATLSFGAGVRVVIDSLLESCELELGERTELFVGAAGVLGGCRIVGPGDVKIAGHLFEAAEGGAPALRGLRSLVVTETGTLVGRLEPGAAPPAFGFERGCRLRLVVGRGEGAEAARVEATSRATPLPPVEGATVIETGVDVRGSINAPGPVIVRGRLEGELEAPIVEVAPGGALGGRVKARELRSSGTLGGEIDADSCELSGTLKQGAVVRARSLSAPLRPAGTELGLVLGGCELVVGEPAARDEVVAKVRSLPAAAQAASGAAVEVSPKLQGTPEATAEAEDETSGALAVAAASSPDREASEAEAERPDADRLEAAARGDARDVSSGRGRRRNRPS